MRGFGRLADYTLSNYVCGRAMNGSDVKKGLNEEGWEMMEEEGKGG